MNDTMIEGLSRDEWLALRRKGIGGSDVPAILGQSPWRTPLDVYLDKLGQAEETPMNDRMQAGIYLEPVVAQMFIDEHPELEVWKDDYMRAHKEYDFMLANTDRLVRDERGRVGVLEIKTTSSWAQKTWDEDVPMYYYLQLQHYINIMDAEYGYLAILVDGYDYVSYYFERDDAWIGTIEVACIDFWNNHVLETDPPDAVNEEDIKNLYPKEIEGAREADALDLQLIAEYIEAKNMAKQFNDKKKQLTIDLKKLIGDSEALAVGDTVVATFKSDSRGVRGLRINENNFGEVQ